MKKMRNVFFGIMILASVSVPLTAFDSSPSNYRCLPEVIWAPATGGGTWCTEIQITGWTTGAVIDCYFDYGDNWRGINNLWTCPVYGKSVTFSNILETLASRDTGFTYYGRVGALEFYTQGTDYKIHVNARTYNGNYSKTFPGLRDVYSNQAFINHNMVIPFMSNSYDYRATMGLVNPSTVSVTATIYIVNYDNTTLASFTKIVPGFNFIAFYPFTEGGIPYPAHSYSNTYVLITVTSNPGLLYCFGATGNNITNDPSAHIAQSMN